MSSTTFLSILVLTSALTSWNASVEGAPVQSCEFLSKDSLELKAKGGIKKVRSLSDINKQNVAPWRNRHANKTGILFGSGQSLNKYEHTAEDEKGKQVITFGTNGMIYWKGGVLDHLFVCDGGNRGKKATKKWFAYFRNKPDHGPNSEARERANASYFEVEGPCAQRIPLVKDVGRYSFSLTRSSIFVPFVFALFTGVDRLYVVGCDVADTGYANWKHEAAHLKKVGRPFSKMKEAWFWAYTWQQRFYPQVDIVLVNPVGLRGKIGWPQIDVGKKQGIFSPKSMQTFLSQKASLQSKRKLRTGSKAELGGSACTKDPTACNSIVTSAFST
ncbi:hypothetical protein CYMTET_50894 [Cymbomonas tetramitiformis]|uniref:Uncharacterized protein n=1 Tax=Cymbomonas tetramitiformis TaxID=36881 RepID=A0AAE0BMD1_9CHLO|nr:hypothetical protein CYMTET_50894 [Cymbomonas tetramitiformis]